MRIVRVALSCSLAALLGTAWAGPYADLATKLHSLSSPQAKVDAVDASRIVDGELAKYREQAENLSPDGIRALTDFVDLKAIAEQSPPVGDAVSSVKKLKSSPLYADEGVKKQANWLAGAIERVQRLFTRKEEPKPYAGPDLNLPQMPFLIYFVWILLGGAIVAFVIYALRFVSFSKLKKRRAKAMLEEDEPERTLDEWLTLADAFERDGRYREAVRALYLACLLKFDERNVARFLRGQTNWEHLSRIEASPRRPADLDFRSPTQAFDRIWYGHKVRGQEDVRDFRSWYLEIGRQLESQAAA